VHLHRTGLGWPDPRAAGQQVRHDHLVDVDHGRAQEGRRLLPSLLSVPLLLRRAEERGPQGHFAGRPEAQSSTVQATELEEKYKNSEIKLYPTQDEVNLDLVSGRIDLLFVDKLPGLDWLKSKDGANYEFVGTDLPTDGVGAAVRKEDSDLRDQLSAAIEAIKADGTYDKINAKYFPFSIWKD
jgi:hypothetical protein